MVTPPSRDPRHHDGGETPAARIWHGERCDPDQPAGWRSAAVMRGYVEEGGIWNDNAAARLGL